jgi:hypothetical protein
MAVFRSAATMLLIIMAAFHSQAFVPIAFGVVKALIVLFVWVVVSLPNRILFSVRG